VIISKEEFPEAYGITWTVYSHKIPIIDDKRTKSEEFLFYKKLINTN